MKSLKFNSLTAYPPLHWWGWLLYPLALLKCNKRVIRQYKDGRNDFFIEITVTEQGDVIANNGVYDVKADVYDIVYRLNYLNKNRVRRVFVDISPTAKQLDRNIFTDYWAILYDMCVTLV